MKRALALLVLLPSAALADDRDACLAAADRGLRDEAKLIEARESFLLCARDPCPGVLSRQCGEWLRAVDQQVPTISIRARDPSGKDASDVQVLVDGAVRATLLDGQPLALDPGVHAFVWRREGAPDVSETLVIRAGEKNRLVDVVIGLPPAEPAAPPPAPKTTVAPAPTQRSLLMPALSIASAALGVAGFVTIGTLAASASEDAARLRTDCAPLCSPSQVDDVRAKITAANVALGIGVAGLVLGAVFLLVSTTTARSAARWDGVRVLF